ncbi:hypothetical protein AN958_01051 [Leucoagaricus sp. SymC.cos]|nr:hypothetical protein AN958_01051 [Leucoagaricus sp. SymC.cos]
MFDCGAVRIINFLARLQPVLNHNYHLILAALSALLLSMFFHPKRLHWVQMKEGMAAFLQLGSIFDASGSTFCVIRTAISPSSPAPKKQMSLLVCLLFSVL